MVWVADQNSLPASRRTQYITRHHLPLTLKTTSAATNIVDDAVSNCNISAGLYVDDVIDCIQPVASAVERHVSRAAVHQLLILQFTNITKQTTYIIQAKADSIR